MLILVIVIAVVVGLLALDLGVFNREDHVVSAREALGWTALWITVSLLFNGLIYLLYEYNWLGVGVDIGHSVSGSRAAIDFFTAYVVEKSLSLDNIFVIAMVFGYFRIPSELQHRVLFWGIFGALVLRGAMIGAGIAAIERFDWLIYIFGGLLVFTAIKMMVSADEKADPGKSLLVRAIGRLIPVTDRIDGHRFFVVEAGRRAATPLFVALLVVEGSDVLFAVDSIPAVFGVTLDPFIVFTSNVFAILGLRSLYFALAVVIDRFRYIKISLVAILAFVGAKMIASHHVEIPALASLGVILGALAIGIIASSVGRDKPGKPGKPGKPSVEPQ